MMDIRHICKNNGIYSHGVYTMTNGFHCKMTEILCKFVKHNAYKLAKDMFENDKHGGMIILNIIDKSDCPDMCIEDILFGFLMTNIGAIDSDRITCVIEKRLEWDVIEKYNLCTDDIRKEIFLPSHILDERIYNIRFLYDVTHSDDLKNFCIVLVESENSYVLLYHYRTFD